MVQRVELELSEARSFLDQRVYRQLEKKIPSIHRKLHESHKPYDRHLGWIDWPYHISKREIERIKETAETIQQQSEAFILVGVGGSYLGARAAIEMFNHTFHNILDENKRDVPQIFYAGHHFNPTYMRDLMDIIKTKNVSINVVSKSGTTTETVLAFRYLRQFMEQQYGKVEATKRIVVTTGDNDGTLNQIAKEEGYKTFYIPEQIGGRYSVLTSVGLFPMAVTGIDIDAVVSGAYRASDVLQSADVYHNEAYHYALVRNTLYRSGKNVELFATADPAFHSFSEWWKQLFAESEGKEGKGLFPATAQFSTDLHSIGQYIQEGERHLFETALSIQRSFDDIPIDWDPHDKEGLNYLYGQSFGDVSYKALEGARLAHVSGGVPSIMITVPEKSSFYFGYLAYFFQKACAMSGLLMDINPFNQDGVEAYKSNMFALLEKPGYEAKKKELDDEQPPAAEK